MIINIYIAVVAIFGIVMTVIYIVKYRGIPKEVYKPAVNKEFLQQRL